MNNILKKRKSYKCLIWAFLTLVLIVGLGTAVVLINGWFESHRLVIRSPVEVNLFKPLVVEKREPKVVVEKFVLDYPDEIDTSIEKYICEKWGPFDCKTALAVFSAESGLKEDALNINNNNTIDYGIAQINSIHYKKPGCSLKDISDQYKNVDCAYKIWKDSGWGAWVGFNNGNFKTHL